MRGRRDDFDLGLAVCTFRVLCENMYEEVYFIVIILNITSVLVQGSYFI